MEPLAGRRGAARRDATEDLGHGGSVAHVAVGGPGGGVEKVDVDPVGIVRGADGRDRFERGARLAPPAAGHAAGVVDEEDGVEGAEEGVAVVGAGEGCRGGWMCWCWCRCGCWYGCWSECGGRRTGGVIGLIVIVVVRVMVWRPGEPA